MTTERPADAGFHRGEIEVQKRAGVEAEAARLSGMLEPVDLVGGIVPFLGDQTFGALTAHDANGSLWVSPLIGPPGFLHVASPTVLEVFTRLPEGDPLRELPVDQPIGMVVIEFAASRRVRVNGRLVHTGDRLVVSVEQAFGNCRQYIQQRVLEIESTDDLHVTVARQAATLNEGDIALIRRSDTLILGTTNPGRGSDATHRGGPPGFVRVDGTDLWWPDYAGNNLFNSFGNLEVDPQAALLFPDFDSGATLQLSGSARVEWGAPGQVGDDGHTGRRVRFTVERLVTGQRLAARETEHRAYPRNPELTD
jgi:predicted pyridoxine 5'-phosphate oxidase superfamily flavin-nucleotide-binding protein